MTDVIKNIRWEIEPTCNLNCKHCFVACSEKKYDRRINFREAKSIIDNLCKLGVEEIYFTTREPLLHPDILKIVSYCDEKKIGASLITNGFYLIKPEISRTLLEKNVGSLSISLEGPTEETNDQIRGAGSFGKALEGVMSFQTEMLLQDKFIPINLQMSLNKCNVEIVDDIPNIVNDLPFDTLSIGGLSVTGNAKLNKEIVIDDGDYYALFRRIAEAYIKIENTQFILIFKSLLPWESILMKYESGYDCAPNIPSCSATKGTYSLLSNGEMASCISVYDPNKTITVSAKKYDEIKRINERFAEEIREYSKRNKERVLSMCKDCYYADTCFFCPVITQDDAMCSQAVNRCRTAKSKAEEIIKKHYCDKSIIKLDKSHILFSYNQLICQKTFDDSMRKEKVYDMDSEEASIIRRLSEKGYINCKSKFEDEHQIIKSLLFDGFIKIERM